MRKSIAGVAPVAVISVATLAALALDRASFRRHGPGTLRHSARGVMRLDQSTSI
jgi:hypothetical protein